MKKIIIFLMFLIGTANIGLSQSVKHPWKTVNQGGGKIISSQGVSLRSSVANTNARMKSSSGVTLESGFIPGLRNGSGITTTSTLTFASGWNMISLPLKASDTRTSELFPSAASSSFEYDNGYVTRETLNVGKGYWLKFSAENIMSIFGTSTLVETITVSSGWNMMGSISQSIQIANISSIPSGLVTSQFFGYDNGYFSSDMIEPGKGYWVKVNQSGNLVLSSVNSSARGGSLGNTIKIVPSSELPPSPPSVNADNNSIIPSEFSLAQNFPNPFNPSTVIRYQLPVNSVVMIKVYDVLGREVASLVEELQTAGYKEIMFHASALPSGVYFYRMSASPVAGSHAEVTLLKKLLLTK